MSKINPAEEFSSVSVHGTYGRPNGYGMVHYGVDFYGLYIALSGIYRRQPSKKGQVFVRNKFYTPTNPKTQPQQTRREKFALAVLIWQGLSQGQKEEYNALQYPTNMSGYNRFISLWMKN